MGKKRHLVIIGGGAGGLVVASVASQLGLHVTLIEKKGKLGGDCLHSGCVPSKTLIRSAKIASLMRRGAEFGLDAVNPEIDMEKINQRIQSVIEHIQKHDDPERFRGYGCEVLFGRAEFIDAHTVKVNDETIRARRFVIATGSRPFVPPIEGLEEAGYLTNENLFSLSKLPARLVVLGGGAIGVEMAQAFARLGSQVTIVEMAPRLLMHEDAKIADTLQGVLEAEGIQIHTSIRAEKVSLVDGIYHVECSDCVTLQAEQLLVAVGRRPVTEGIGLEAAGVRCDSGGIQVDSRMRSSQKHIYACGDVCGPYPFTHMAEYQAGLVISNAIFRFPKKADYSIVPRVTYSDPELAHVGITEKQAKEQGIDPLVLEFPFSDVDRALTEGETQGLSRFVVHKGKLLGATILGPHAGELIHEIALAMKAGVKIAEISATIHAYPTYAQIHRRTVNTWFGKKLFSPGTGRLVRWINRLIP